MFKVLSQSGFHSINTSDNNSQPDRSLDLEHRSMAILKIVILHDIVFTISTVKFDNSFSDPRLIISYIHGGQGL